jgi:uncharacterized protein YdeI (YjbR/CyaY-like superfamily)
VAVELIELIVTDARAWRAWLGEHHADSPGVWLVLAKKGSTQPTSLTYEHALDHALCHGWIDGQIARRDEHTFKQRFTPRRPRSAWSARNVAHIQRLAENGLMHPAGVAAVERAKADGRWDQAYAGQASIDMPADLASALDASPQAHANFELLTSQNRYAILYRVTTAKRADTRARRIEQYVDMLARGDTIHPQRRRLVS